MLITRTSIFTKKTRTIELPITQEQWDRWQSGGEVIQNVLSHLTMEQREFLLTGSTQEEWDEYMKDEEE